MLSKWGWQDGWARFQRWNLSNSRRHTGFTFSQSKPTTPSVFILIWPFHSCQGKQRSHIRTWTHQQSKPHLQVVWPAPISREDQDITYAWSSELWLVFQMGAQWILCCDKHVKNHTGSLKNEVNQLRTWGNKWKKEQEVGTSSTEKKIKAGGRGKCRPSLSRSWERESLEYCQQAILTFLSSSHVHINSDFGWVSNLSVFPGNFSVINSTMRTSKWRNVSSFMNWFFRWHFNVA